MPELDGTLMRQLSAARFTNAKLIFTPKLIPDELLTSWIARMSVAHKIYPKTFIYLFFGVKFHATDRDYDFRCNEQLISTISSKTKISTDDIRSMTLQTFSGYLFKDPNSLSPPMQIRSISRRQDPCGLMYCPKCLASDKIPYWRKEWRLRHHNACVRHNCLLLDRCPQCKSPINLLRLSVDGPIVFCGKCGFDLRLAKTRLLYKEKRLGLDAIKYFDEIIDNGAIEIDGSQIHSVMFFEVLHRFEKLLDRGATLTLNDYPLLKEYKRLKRNESASDKIYLQFLQTSMTHFLFADFSNNFTAFLASNKLRHIDFFKDMLNAPLWYIDTIGKYSQKHNYFKKYIHPLELAEAVKVLSKQGIKITKKSISRILGCDVENHVMLEHMKLMGLP